MNALDDYLENQVLTASPYRLHLMVLDAAIRFARQGGAAMQESRWEAMEQAFSRARDCLTELIGGINPDLAPDVARNVKSLFAAAYERLALAELLRNALQLDEALRLLQFHRETWIELGERLNSNGGASAVAAPHVPGRSWVT
jgi:flagellar protein FliS